ncbi:hypothetical protein AVEN_23987-1 [Araneus ventricosus]|uniref:Uncharacterized protein n=1 Tax=Araneus ventricosus TaxID=182803 RepID=A0A4Y2D1K1_ARAVE|nr:hypothetical protein AVEN_23987-1 [Araneus ventricosus]
MTRPTRIANFNSVAGQNGHATTPEKELRPIICDRPIKAKPTLFYPQNRTPSLTPVPVTRPVTERFDGQDTGILFKKKKNKINKKKEIYTLCTAQAFSLLHY